MMNTRPGDVIEIDIPTIEEALEGYMRASRRMASDWSESDEAVKNRLWRDLHACHGRAVLAMERAPIVRGGQGRTVAEMLDKGWMMLIIWSAAFFVAGVVVGVTL